MRTCVIGGAGFIGAALVRLLVASGREVVVLGRRPQAAVALPPGVAYISGDYGDRSVLRGALRAAGEVVDLAYATVPQTSFVDPVFDILANLPPSVGLLQEAAEAAARRVLIVSSGGTVYGKALALPLGEDHPTRPISPYGITKLTIEHYARMVHAVAGLPVTIVRPANAYGPSQRSDAGQGFIAAAAHAIARGRRISLFGARGTVRDYIHVSDVARGILAALECGEAGATYNIGTGIGHDNAQVLALLAPLAGAAGLELHVETLPARSFDVPANVLDATRLRACSGWRPLVDLAAGLAEVWEAALREARD